MKVNELIEVLKTMPPDALVLIPMESGYETPRVAYLTEAAENANEAPGGRGMYLINDVAFSLYETVGELFEVVVIDTEKGIF